MCVVDHMLRLYVVDGRQRYWVGWIWILGIMLVCRPIRMFLVYFFLVITGVLVIGR